MYNTSWFQDWLLPETCKYLADDTDESSGQTILSVEDAKVCTRRMHGVRGVPLLGIIYAIFMMLRRCCKRKKMHPLDDIHIRDDQEMLYTYDDTSILAGGAANRMRSMRGTTHRR